MLSLFLHVNKRLYPAREKRETTKGQLGRYCDDEFATDILLLLDATILLARIVMSLCCDSSRTFIILLDWYYLLFLYTHDDDATLFSKFYVNYSKLTK